MLAVSNAAARDIRTSSHPSALTRAPVSAEPNDRDRPERRNYTLSKRHYVNASVAPATPFGLADETPSPGPGTVWHTSSCPGPVTPLAVLFETPIRNHLRPGGSVYDPFLGSGTALIAAERTGTICRAMEIDPIYVEVALRRWERFSDDEAERIDG